MAGREETEVPFLEVEDGRLFYKIQGEGDPLVLIHGAWTSHQWWQWQVPALSRRYRVVSLDVRGHGKSSPLKGPYSVDGFLKDLDTLLREEEIDQTALVGWSLGGMISIAYGLKHPSEVKALVLIATRGHRNPKIKRSIILKYLQARLSLLTDFTAPRKYDRAAERFPGRGRDWPEGEVRRMLAPTAPKEVHDWVIADLRQNPNKNYFEVAKSFWNWEAGEALKRIQIPTLIMVGDQDTRTPPRFSRLLHDKIPHSKLIIVENAGHCLPLERPDRVTAEIMDFLKSLND